MTPSELAQLVEPVAGVIPYRYIYRHGKSGGFVNKHGDFLDIEDAELAICEALQRRVDEAGWSIQPPNRHSGDPTHWKQWKARSPGIAVYGTTRLQTLVAANVKIEEGK